MIQPLRARHRWMMPFVGMIALVGLIAGVSARVTMPVMDQIPGEISLSTEHLQEGLWGALPLSTAWGMDKKGRPTVTLKPNESLLYPELLVYWHTGTWNGKIGEQATLLGTLSGINARRFVMPSKKGTLVLYSLAQGEVVAVMAVEGGGVQTALMQGGLK
jgi:hypothetical protein